MRRWISSIIMVLLIMLTTFLTSCGRTETPQVESNQSSHSNQEVEKNQEEEVVRDDQPAGKNIIEQLQLTDSSYENINQLLDRYDQIEMKSWSHNHRTVAFAIYTQDRVFQMYLWKVGNTAPEAIKGVADDALCKFNWSPNDEYLIADAGTFVQRGGYLVDIQDSRYLYFIGYVGNAVWSPDSKYVAFSLENKSIQVLDRDPGALDLVLFNIENQEITKIEEGTPEVNYWPMSWDADGTLHYRKSNSQTGDVEELIYIYK